MKHLFFLILIYGNLLTAASPAKPSSVESGRKTAAGREVKEGYAAAASGRPALPPPPPPLPKKRPQPPLPPVPIRPLPLSPKDKAFFKKALESGDEQAALEYIRKNPDVANMVDEEGHSLLLMAFWEDRPSLPVIRELINRTKIINHKCIHGETVLHNATSFAFQIVRLLLARGARVNAASSIGITPLMNAMDTQNQETLNLLLKAGADVHATNTGRSTPLHFAIHQELKFPPHKCENCEHEHGEEGEHVRVPAAQQIKTVALLLDHGANLEAVAYYNSTPLMTAVAAGNAPVVDYLIRRNANIEALSETGITPLQRSILDHKLALHNPDLSAADRTENLHKILRVMQLLLAEGANTNLPNNEPLASAIGFCDLVAVQQLLLNRANPDECANRRLSQCISICWVFH